LLFAGPAWTPILHFILLTKAGMRCVRHCAWLLVEMGGGGLVNFLPRLVLNHDPSSDEGSGLR
jgi:hypothetical protein